MEKLLVVWIKDQKNHNISLSQNLFQSKALILFSFVKAEGSEKAAEEKYEVSKVGEERNCLYNIKELRKAASAVIEVAASSPENLAEIINEGV